MIQYITTIRVAARRRETGFTLIELLIVTAIIGVMAGGLMTAIRGLLEEGRIARTKSQIARIDGLLSEKWESYRTRAVPIRVAAGTSPQQAARTRLFALRELMKFEMPDRATDVSDQNVVNLATIPALNLSYNRRVANSPTWGQSLASPECLYMILQCTTDGDGNGLSFFVPSEMGDLDADGVPEILDAWKTPIAFIRWAPGFISDRQQNADFANTAIWKIAPDPFDPMLGDPRWMSGSNKTVAPPNNQLFALYPLVISAGPDKSLGLFYDPPGPPAFNYRLTDQSTQSCDPLNSSAKIPYDPYAILSGNQVGTPVLNDNSSFDNVHNHLIEIK